MPVHCTYDSLSSLPPTYDSRVRSGAAGAASRRLPASLLSTLSDSHLKREGDAESSAGIARQLRTQYSGSSPFFDLSY
jgi:hypothetical protein